MERQDLIAQEANAIGTAWLRADLLDEPHGSELRAALEAYTAHRLDAVSQLQGGWDGAVLAEVEPLQARIWRAARVGVAARPELALAVLDPINETFDLHSLRVNAALKHLPYLVMALLIGCSLLAVNVIGYGCGIDGRRPIGSCAGAGRSSPRRRARPRRRQRTRDGARRENAAPKELSNRELAIGPGPR